MGKPLHFKGSSFHRVITQFMCVRAARARAAIRLLSRPRPQRLAPLRFLTRLARAALDADARRCQGGDFTAGNGTGASSRLVRWRADLRALCTRVTPRSR